MLLQELPAVCVDIFPPNEGWFIRVRWDRKADDVGQLWSKILTKVTKSMATNSSKVSGIAFGSLVGSMRVTDEDDLMSLIESAGDDGETKIQLRAIIQVHSTYFTCTSIEGCRHFMHLYLARCFLICLVVKRPPQLF